ncbi:MAG TPA: oligoribonuclease [Burkholderiaceae bacterium]|nr:oligoribonuclease [Burkholderiaceae bacterium]
MSSFAAPRRHTHEPYPPHPSGLIKSDANLVWLDCEMSGLDPEKDRLLEVAVVITGPDLTPRVEGPVMVIHQSDEVLGGMDAWNRGTHGRSGLTEKVRVSTVTEAEAEAELLAFVRRFVPKGVSPLCGNTVHQDRRFLVRYMPALDAHFHYRCLDVSTLKELAKRWQPKVFKAFKKKQMHTALADVHESIDELVHYRTHFLRMPDVAPQAEAATDTPRSAA